MKILLGLISEEADECEAMIQERDTDDFDISVEDEVMSSSIQENDDDCLSDKDEVEYQKKDPVKKWQIDYNTSTCFTNDYPELTVRSEVDKSISIAPGEGKHPTNILEEIDWDIKSFPVLLPDGKKFASCQKRYNFIRSRLFRSKNYEQGLKICKYCCIHICCCRFY